MRVPAGLVVLFALFACQKEDNAPIDSNPPIDYRDNFTGIYQGEAQSYHAVFNDYSETQHSIETQIALGTMDSTLNILLIYDGQDSSEITDWKIPENGISSQSAGSGSSYQSLSIIFTPDSMEYDYFGKCGIPCSSGTYFKI